MLREQDAYVRWSFDDAALSIRERRRAATLRLPTAIPIEPQPLAIPHTVAFGIAMLIALASLLLLPSLAPAQTVNRPASTSVNSQSPARLPAANKSRTARVKPAELASRADGLVKDALYYEIYADQAQRDRLLAEARELSPNFAPAQWQSGKVKFNNQWMNSEEVSSLTSRNDQLTRYRSQRNNFPDTAAGHLSLARWCDARGLDEQSRAHYTNVLDSQPDLAEARNKLGFRRLNGVWVTEAELDAINQEAKQLAKAFDTWAPVANRIREALLSSNTRINKTAEQELAKIDDVAAIPVLERILSASSEAGAVKFVSRLADWHDPQATRSLTRQALFSNWDAIRQLAAHILQGRPYEEYVPNLIDMLRSTVQVRSEVLQNGNQVVLREFFVREGAGAWELLTLDTAYNREARANGDATDTLSRAIADMRTTNMRRQSAVNQQNTEQTQLNERIVSCLTLATGKTNLDSADDWWRWWNNENELVTSEVKSVVPRYGRSDIYLEDQVYTLPPSSPPPAPRAECLAAGTPVWTLTGPQPIERLSVGDLVLSQDVESGELAYKPVLRRTIRPAGAVFKIEIEGQTYRASGGHFFWVAGEGWTKARNLRSGNVLHCCGKTVNVSDAAETNPEPTYNLVVADFSTYFIGPEKILSHDVTLRQPTRSIVPGLVRE